MLATSYRDGAAITPTTFEIASLKTWIDTEFNAIPCAVRFWSGDIGLAECKAAFAQFGVLNISTANNIHPFLTPAQNAKFRAIHDWHHIEIGAPASLEGEYATYCHAASIAPHSIGWMLFSEIVLQAAAAIHFGDFQAQKLVKVGGF
jgi:hypothetical protein